jgi:hypothetical protein
MWEPRPLTPLWAFTACYRDSFTLLFFIFYLTSPLLENLKTEHWYYQTIVNLLCALLNFKTDFPKIRLHVILPSAILTGMGQVASSGPDRVF